MQENKPTVFISYSHKDEPWKDRLVKQLGVLRQEGLLDLWDDSRIGPGQDWREEIERAMNAASVAVLLISADFLTSQFILGEEIPRLLKRREREGLHICPIIVRPCTWEDVKWLKRMQVRPHDGRALSGGNEHEREANLASIAKEIFTICSSIMPYFPLDYDVHKTVDRLLQRTKSISSQLIAVGCPGAVRNFWIFVERELQDDLMKWATAEREPFYVVVDGAGYGKTILLAQLAQELAEIGDVVPMLVGCETLLEKEKGLNVAIAERLGLGGAVLGHIDHLVQSGLRPILLLDTLDLLHAEQIRQLRQMAIDIIGHGAKVLGTCRPLEFAPLSDTAARVELKPFSPEEINRILGSYREKEGKEPPPLTEKAQEIFRIPLHLRMFLEIYHPDEKSEDANFIEMFSRYWHHKVESERSRYVERRALGEDERATFLATKRACLEAFLLLQLESHEPSIPEEEIATAARRLLEESYPDIDVGLVDPVLRDLRDEGVLVLETLGLKFFHQFFLEFALAKMVVEPLMRHSSQAVGVVPSFLGRVEAMLIKQEHLEKELSKGGRVGSGGWLRKIFGKGGLKSTAQGRRLQIISAFAALGNDYRPARGGVVQTLLLKRDQWGEQIVSLLAASNKPVLVTLAKDYYAAIRDKAPHMLLK